MHYEIIPFEPPPGWYAVKENGTRVWYGTKEVCKRFVSDEAFRAECLRSKMIGPRP